MPTNQQLVNLIATKRGITLSGVINPKFKVNYKILRAIFQPEQVAMLNANPTIRIRKDIGVITLTPPGGGNPVNINTIILLGADGRSLGDKGLPQNGETITLTETSTNAHILIAAGGNGARAGQQRLHGERSHGGSAVVVGGFENLIIALGGIGCIPIPGVGILKNIYGLRGGDGGHSIGIGTAKGNNIFSQGGDGGDGNRGYRGKKGKLGKVGVILATPATIAGFGGFGGNGGKAYVVGDESFGEAIGGSGGNGGEGGPRAPIVSAAGPNDIAPPLGRTGPGGDGGNGGNIKLQLVGNNSLTSTKSKVGPGGKKGDGSTQGKIGAKGVIEK